jgi:predicted MFS family arabinose efflux permease
MASAMPEGRVVVLVAAVQFAAMLDFMMVMPLGPDFAAALGIAQSGIGTVGGAYTLAACIAGVAGSFFLDRFDRRSALAAALCGLALATVAGGLAWDEGSMLAARVAAGLFGGPAMALSLAIVADVVPAERRGRAMGMASAGFALAATVGVPLGLELAQRGGWRLPFFAVGGLALAILAAVPLAVPPLRAHLSPVWPKGRRHFAMVGGLLVRPAGRLSFLLMILTMVAAFAIIPNIAVYVIGNLGFPREELGLLYLAGGVVGLATVAVAGRAVDRFGATVVVAVVTIGIALSLADAFLHAPVLPLLLLIPLLMIFNAARMIAGSTVLTRVPRPEERAGFRSLASAAGAFLSSALLAERPQGGLLHMDRVAAIAIAVTLAVPFVVAALERRLEREAAAAPATLAPAEA